MIPGFVATYAPQIPTTGPLGLAVRAAIGLAGGKLLGRFAGRQFGQDFALGALLAVANDAAEEYLYPNIPGLSMGAYLDPSVAAYLPRQGVGQYLSPGATIPGVSGFNAPGNRLDAEGRF